MDLVILLVVVALWLAVSWISAFVAAQKKDDRRGAPARRSPRQEGEEEIPLPEDHRPSRRSTRRDYTRPAEVDTQTRARRQVSDARTYRPRTQRRPSRAKKGLAKKLTDPEGMATAVMLAEVLGPPRAMRRHRPPVSQRRGQ